MSLMNSSPLRNRCTEVWKWVTSSPPLNFPLGNTQWAIKVDEAGMVGKAEKTLEQKVSLWSSAHSRCLRSFSRFTTCWRCRLKVRWDLVAPEICSACMRGAFQASFPRFSAAFSCFCNGVCAAFRRLSPASGRGTLQGWNWALLLQHDHPKVRDFLLWGLPGKCQQLQELSGVPENMFQNPK